MKEADRSPYLARFESFEVNLRAGELHRNGERIKLPEQSFQILTMLMERAGEVLTRQEIQQKLWPNDTVVEFENSINAAIKRLRMALGDSADQPTYIETLARRGYRWKVPVEWTVPTPAEPQSPSAQRVAPSGDSAAFHLIGKRVSHYRVLEVLGGGGMGVVFKAEDIRLGRRVALKFLSEELAHEEGALERFEREARAASALNHPNICTIYEVEEYNGQPFIVMELLEGQTLRDLISAAGTSGPEKDSHKARLPLATLLNIATQVVDGLDAAHKKGFIHRDIKPANVFICSSGTAKILDFGLAKLVSSTSETTVTSAAPLSVAPKATVSSPGALLGTLMYMSPEQVRGQDLDQRTDLFSFGALLYEMATAVAPFSGPTPNDIKEAILNRMPTEPERLNPQVPNALGQIIRKSLEKNREHRYQNAAELRTDLQQLRREPESRRVNAGVLLSGLLSFAKPKRRWILVSGIALILVIVSAIFLALRRRAVALGETDWVLVSDFVNATGDPVFDGSLKQAVTVKLSESPYFNVVLDSVTRQTLGLMGRSPDERVVPPVAREVCEREGAKVVVGGSIVALGDKYTIDLDATNCLTGTSIAHEEGAAKNRDRVLQTLGQIIPLIRRRLGESLTSIQKFDTPIEEATTTSLSALKAYTQGDDKRAHGEDAESVPFYKMAIDLDPNFAIAYARLGTIYTNLAQVELADEYMRKAFERREHVSEREKFYIAAHYYVDAAHEYNKAIETYRLWADSYPHDWIPYSNVSNEYARIGQPEKAVEAGQQALHLNPNHAFPYNTLTFAYFRASQFAEAKAIGAQAIAAKRDGLSVHISLYMIAVVEDDEQGMKREVEWFKGKPVECWNLNHQAWAAASRGQLRAARDSFNRSRAAAMKQELKDYAVTTINDEAQVDAELGNAREARAEADVALRLMPESAESYAGAALVLARVGDFGRAEELLKEAAKRYPSQHTLFNNVNVPSVHAAVALGKKAPAEAIEELRHSVPYDLSDPTNVPDGATMYYRGLAYLELHSGNEAAGQFQKVLDNPGIVSIGILRPLSHLGLARAYTLTGDKDKSLAQYREFLALWKDADPDLRMLREAKAEYASLSKSAR